MIEQAMQRAVAYSQTQYAQVVDYVQTIDSTKAVHIGETGWSSVSDGFYGPEGSRAADEYKQALFYQGMREWTQSSGISCFFFEAFDEPWKSAANPTDSENHFGLFTVEGEAKVCALWPLVAQGVFERLDPGWPFHHKQRTQGSGNCSTGTYCTPHGNGFNPLHPMQHQTNRPPPRRSSHACSCLGASSCIRLLAITGLDRRWRSFMNGATARIFIQGVCYHPVAIGEEKRSFDNLTEDLALMREMGVNTIRVYEPIASEEVLDAISDAGLSVIMGFGYDQDGVFDLKSGTYIDYVQAFKSHPAILLWELGNEYNYHPEWFDGSPDLWYETLKEASAAIQTEDPNHPVSTAHGEVPDEALLAELPDIDVWGLNVYRWDVSYTAAQDFAKVSDKPMYFAELGADSYMKTAAPGLRRRREPKRASRRYANPVGAALLRFCANSGRRGLLLHRRVVESGTAGPTRRRRLGTCQHRRTLRRRPQRRILGTRRHPPQPERSL